MTWSSSPPAWQRAVACLPYLIPLMDAILFYGNSFFAQFPELQVVLIPLQPILIPYASIILSIPFAGFILFIGIYMAVVRNDNIPRFIRFNAMQSIVLGIVMGLFSIVWGYLLAPLLGNSGGLIGETIFNVIFLGTVAAVGYSIFQSAVGRYAEIPTLSNAAHMQVR